MVPDSFLFVPKVDVLPDPWIAQDVLDQITLLLQYTPAEIAALPFLYLTPQDLKKELKDLTLIQLGELLATTLAYPKRDFYLIDDLCKDMPGEFFVLLKDRVVNLHKSGATILLLATESIADAKNNRSETWQLFENENWTQMITAWEKAHHSNPPSSEKK